jgi:hypothetical protein
MKSNAPNYLLSLLFVLSSVFVQIKAQTTPLSATFSHTGNGCNFGNTVTVHIVGGVPPYTVLMSGSGFQRISYAVTADTIFSGVDPGVYSFQIRDRSIQNTVFYGSINIPAAYSVSFVNSLAYCNPNQMGQSQYTFSGISTPYSMYWSSGTVSLNQVGLVGNAFLDKGTHRLTVVDANNCELQFSDTIQGISGFNLNVNISNPIELPCGTVANLSSNVSAGVPPYSYLWTHSTGTAITSNLTGMGYGTFNLRVTGNNGCRVNQFVQISEKKGIAVPPRLISPSCTGNNGSFGYSPALTGSYQYAWSTTPVQTTPVATGLPSALLTLNLTNLVSGCTYSQVYFVPDTMYATVNTVAANCPNADGKSWISNPSSPGPFIYAWSNGETQDTAFQFPGGQHSVSISNSNGCTSTIQFFMPSPSQNLNFIQNTEITGCPLPSTYQDTVVPIGGTPPYSYVWDLVPPQFTQSVQVTSVNSNQMVHLIDANSCTHSQYIEHPNGFPIQVNLIPNACNINFTGTLIPNGGTAPYSYTWYTTPMYYGATHPAISPGTYKVTLMDSTYCFSSRYVTVPVLANPLTLTTGYQVINCDTGKIWVSALQGQPPYSYQWNTTPPLFSDTLAAIPHGTYTCYVQDANNCLDTIMVAYNYTLLSIQTQIVPGLCNQSMAWASVQNGQAPYTYNWNTVPPTFTDTIRNLAPGTYRCTISDALNCVDSTTSLVIAPNPLLLQDSSLASFCSNGKAWVRAVNGVAPYTYLWNTQPPQTTDTIQSLSPGLYKCIVTDATGCSDSVIVTVQNGNTSISQSLLHPSCNQPNSGRVTLQVQGGAPPFTYSWNTNPVQNTVTATGLSQGIYLFTVQDINGCVFTGASTLIYHNPSLTPYSTGILPERCFQSDGSISVGVYVPSSPGPYTLTWNTTPVQTGYTATGLTAGNYSVTVTNMQGCSGSGTFTVPSNLQILQTQAQVQHATCLQQNGSATIMPVNGVPPYTWQWNVTPIQNTQTITGLAPGNYSYSFTDQTGCTGSSYVVIQQNIQLLSGGITALAASTCPNYNNGALECNLTGAVTPPVTYLWSNGQITQSISGLIPGNYSVVATDANGCTGNFSTLLQQTIPFSLTVYNFPAHCMQSDGALSFVVNGGTPPFNYLWSLNPSPNGPVALNLPAGAYSVTITDAIGCVVTRPLVVSQTPCGSVVISGRITNDQNANGVEDTGEPGMAGRQVNLTNPPTTTFTNSQGYYTFPPVPVGSYTITTTTPAGFIQTYPAQNNVLGLQAFTPNLVYYFNDFRFNAGNLFQDIRVTSGNYTPARRGFPFQQLVKVQNAGNSVVSPWLNVTYPNHLLYTNSSHPPQTHTQSLKTLNYQMPALQPMTDTLVQVNFITDIAAPIGQTVYFQNQAGPLAGDVNLTNNTMNSGVVLTGPYDPNDNMLIPDYVYGKIGLLGMMDSVLTYRIRFQNNGNDTAINVLVVDTLDAALKRETMEVLMSSHYVETTIDSAGKISFYFPNILLPDSTTNEEGSKGAVFFRITGKVQIGYTVKNTAHIYFDFNEAIVTNTSEYTWIDLEIAQEKLLDEETIRCYPNPSTGNWYIISPEAGEWELSSISGTILRKGILSSGSETEIMGEDLSTGMYVIRVKTESGLKLKKVVKW